MRPRTAHLRGGLPVPAITDYRTGSAPLDIATFGGAHDIFDVRHIVSAVSCALYRLSTASRVYNRQIDAVLFSSSNLWCRLASSSTPSAVTTELILQAYPAPCSPPLRMAMFPTQRLVRRALTCRFLLFGLSHAVIFPFSHGIPNCATLRTHR